MADDLDFVDAASMPCVYGTVIHSLLDKVKYLMDTFGIPRHHIFSSRDVSFLPDVLRQTNNVGVDVVLNSLSGELLHESWNCVAEFGTMIEIGKRDLMGRGKLAMAHFEQNRSYIGVDFAQICADRPVKTSR